MEYKKLYRKKSSAMICGVCAGIAEYFNIDPTIVRLITVILSLGGIGLGVVIYIIAAIIIPFPSIDEQ